MDIADDFCHHQHTAMMIQETDMQDEIHKKEYSSGEKLHLYFSSHKNRSIAGTAGAQPELAKVGEVSCN